MGERVVGLSAEVGKCNRIRGLFSVLLFLIPVWLLHVVQLEELVRTCIMLAIDFPILTFIDVKNLQEYPCQSKLSLGLQWHLRSIRSCSPVGQ